MPNGTAKPLALVQGHRTKAEIRLRSENEQALHTSECCRPSKEVKEDADALRYYKRLIKILSSVDLNEAFYENVLNRYCLLLAEQKKLVDEKEKIQQTWQELDDKKSEIEFLEYARLSSDFHKMSISIERALAKKRDQLLSIEKENLLTIQGKMRAIPKKVEKQEQSPMAELMRRRSGG